MFPESLGSDLATRRHIPEDRSLHNHTAVITSESTYRALVLVRELLGDAVGS
jgi:hypothetical protein